MTHPVVFLMGPTASGKTDSAIYIADNIPSHIISCDSALVYKDMNIGTAKPSKELLADYPHALIDIISPEERYSAEEFRRDALKEIEYAYHNNLLPIIVGGTFLYMRALIEGISPIPPADPSVRVNLIKRFEKEGIAPLYQELETLDPSSANRLEANDSQRILRALEVVLSTGKTLEYYWGLPPKESLPYPFIKFALQSSDLTFLNERIETRFLQMIDNGLIDEVIALKEKYPNLNKNLPSQRAVGYRQMWDYLDGELTKEEAIERGIIATRQYAKRQRTWLRSEKDVNAIDIIEKNSKEKILEMIKTFKS